MRIPKKQSLLFLMMKYCNKSKTIIPTDEIFSIKLQHFGLTKFKKLKSTVKLKGLKTT